MLGGFFVEEKLGAKPHKVVLYNRGSANITGVVDVISFDENQVILSTE